MTIGMKLIAVGDSVGLVLPKELLARLGVGLGDTLVGIETPDGLRLTASNPEFEAHMEVARRVMEEHRAVLRNLPD